MKDQQSLLARLGFAAALVAITLAGIAASARFPLSVLELGTYVFLLLPAPLFFGLIRTYRGAVRFGSLTILVAAGSWIVFALTVHEFRGFYLLMGVAANVVVIVTGAVLEGRLE